VGVGARGDERGDAVDHRLRGLTRFAAIAALAVAALGGAAAAATGTAWATEGVITTVAGTGVRGNTGDGGPATAADIDRPRSIFVTAAGGYVFAEAFSHRVRAVSSDGTITTIAGTGVAGFSGDGGPATQAQLNFVHSASPTPDGGLLLADTLNNRIRRVSPDGIITTVAGTGAAGYSGDGGAATRARINNPRGVTALPDGGFLIPDTNNHRVRRVWPNGVITTVAGTGTQGFSGDGGAATAARLSIPFGAAPTADGGFLIVETGNQRVRRVRPDGIITTVAGTGVGGYSGDGGPAVAAQIQNPHNIVATSDGGFVFTDTWNHRVRRVAADGSISTVAGNGVAAFGGDGGPGPDASLYYPKGVAETAAGTLLIADEFNDRVRSLAPPPPPPPPPTAPANTSPPTITGTPEVGATLTATPGTWTGTEPITYAYQWRRCDSTGTTCTDIPDATATTYTATTADTGATLTVAVTATNAATVAAYPNRIDADGATAAWRFADSTATLTDRLGPADGTYVGSPQQAAAGLVVGDPNTATAFDGTSQYAGVPAGAWNPKAFTIEVLVRPTVVPVNRTIWAAQGAFTGWWLNTGPTGNLRVYIGDGKAWRILDSRITLQPGVRHHLVVTYDGARARIYVDGTLAATGNRVVMKPNGTTTTMRFGSPSEATGQYWPGTLDDASFYPRALTASQVSAHDAAALGPRPVASQPTPAITAA